MVYYDGNGIYEFIKEKSLKNYYFLTKTKWLLLYGGADLVPKILVYVVGEDILKPGKYTEDEITIKTLKIAEELGLHIFFVKFSKYSDRILVCQPEKEQYYQEITYDELRVLYNNMGIEGSGTVGKAVNKYSSSSYHEWQRRVLKNIVVTDLDLLELKNDRINRIIELKRSYYSVDKWVPFYADYDNFALIINAIIKSGKNIPFYIYYYYYSKEYGGKRIEDLSQISTFKFIIPFRPINGMSKHTMKYEKEGIFGIGELIR